MTEVYTICGYTRISVDLEEDRDNTSIENQKAIIADFVRDKFPGSRLDIYTDRDRSGYTFEQREDYQRMRRKMLSHQYDILIIKDFSRFSRRNSRGLVELEDLRDAGMRIISIGDNVDYPNDDDWLKIQFQFLINEMPVTDASKKVKSVIKRRQNDGKWICAVPYGYVITNTKAMTYEVDKSQAEVVRKIFELYNEGWGYQKIAGYLTGLHIPTPRMTEKERREEQGLQCRTAPKPRWSIITVQGILDNDFYIGTLRQGKYTRRKINGKDVKREESEHIVFENHHQPIIDYRTFAVTRELRKKRGETNYRGQRINSNVYSGFIYCGDCGSPMFAMSRRDLKPAYTCGAYHRQGLKGCTSHHIHVEILDQILKAYLRRVRDESEEMIKKLEEAVSGEESTVKEETDAIGELGKRLEAYQEELLATKRQKIRDILRHPEDEAVLEETYDRLERELSGRIEGLRNQIKLTLDKRNNTIRAERAAKTAMEVFDEVIEKNSLDKTDLELIIEKIFVFEDHIDVKLKRDIDSLLSCGTLEEEACGAADPLKLAESIVQSAVHRKDKLFSVNIIRDGDPLEIYTDKDGGVIFKKYSLMGGLSEFADQICDSLHKATGHLVLISDRDTYIAAAGAPRRDLVERHISPELERIMEGRQVYQVTSSQSAQPALEDGQKYLISTAAPILAEGDVLGCVVFASQNEREVMGPTEFKLAQTVAGFLGRHMET